MLGEELRWLEPSHILLVEEHVLHRGAALVNLDGIAREEHPLDDQSIWVHRVEGARSEQLRGHVPLLIALVPENQHRAGPVADRTKSGGRHEPADGQESLKALLVVSARRYLAENRPRRPAAESADKSQLILALDGVS
eukprot:scaffold2119_cov264-Pinguiococcus_pyrenoidosus.AAC.17